METGRQLPTSLGKAWFVAGMGWGQVLTLYFRGASGHLGEWEAGKPLALTRTGMELIETGGMRGAAVPDRAAPEGHATARHLDLLHCVLEFIKSGWNWEIVCA